jgi:2-iminobutanoate/2-iminopropanoate deaminase
MTPRILRPLIVALGFALVAAPASAQATAQYLGAGGILSSAVRVGNILYLSGQLGTDSAGKLVEGGIGPETKQTLENIKRVLERNGSSMDRVVKCTVFLVDIAEWSAMNTEYLKAFTGNKPARSAVGTNGLVRNARVEIECFATVG